MSADLGRIARGLHAPEAAVAGFEEIERRAAVAAVFSPGDALKVLLMRRAERPGDRWSGQVSFPGGHAEPVDPDLASTARRETREEVGVDLEAAELLGCLPTRRAKARGRAVPMTITPFVFVVDEPPKLDLGPEAAHAFWLPFGPALDGELDDHYLYDTGAARIRLPAWRHEADVIWGMTYEMLQELGALARA